MGCSTRNIKVTEINLPQQGVPKSRRTSCTMYGSSRLTYHQGTRSGLVSVHVSVLKAADVLPSRARCGTPPSSVDTCIGAFPAATFSTAEEYQNVISALEDREYRNYVNQLKVGSVMVLGGLEEIVYQSNMQ